MKYASDGHELEKAETRELSDLVRSCPTECAKNRADLWRRDAIYVDKVLKSALPSELPVQQPTSFEQTSGLRRR